MIVSGKTALPLLMKAFNLKGKIKKIVLVCDVREVPRLYVEKFAEHEELIDAAEIFKRLPDLEISEQRADYKLDTPERTNL